MRKTSSTEILNWASVKGEVCTSKDNEKIARNCFPFVQVLFLLYHYYEAREVYNAIRVFIAGYVWMTGFGNFSYYYKTGNYSFSR